MKRLFRYVCVLLAAFTLLSLVTVAGAAGTQVIDASHTSAGYVTVSYTSAARLKVGIQYGSGKTALLRPGPGQRHLHRQRLPEPLRHLLPGRGQPDHARDHRQRQRPLPDLHQ